MEVTDMKKSRFTGEQTAHLLASRGVG